MKQIEEQEKKTTVALMQEELEHTKQNVKLARIALAISLVALLSSVIMSLAELSSLTKQISHLDREAFLKQPIEESYEKETAVAFLKLIPQDKRYTDDSHFKDEIKEADSWWNGRPGFVVFCDRLLESSGVTELLADSVGMNPAEYRHMNALHKGINMFPNNEELPDWVISSKNLATDDYNSKEYFREGESIYGSDMFGFGPYYPYRGRSRSEIAHVDEGVLIFESRECLFIYYRLGVWSEAKQAYLPYGPSFHMDRLMITIRKPRDLILLWPEIVDENTTPERMLSIFDQLGVLVSPFRWGWKWPGAMDTTSPDLAPSGVQPYLTLLGLNDYAYKISDAINTAIYNRVPYPNRLPDNVAVIVPPLYRATNQEQKELPGE